MSHNRIEESDLERVYAMALAARAANQTMIRFEMEPRRRFMERYMLLWNGAIGKVVGRTAAPAHDSLEAGKFEVASIIVEVGAVDVIEAYRVAKTREINAASNAGTRQGAIR